MHNLETRYTLFIHLTLIVKITNQRTNGPVNAHLIYGPSKRKNIQNLDPDLD